MPLKQPFHIIIGENHLRPLSIQTVQALIELLKSEMDLNDLVICLEEKQASAIDIQKNYNNLKNSIHVTANNVKAGATYQQLVGSFPTTNSAAIHKAILYSTFGVERFNALGEFLQFARIKNIQFCGIDDSPNRDYFARTIHMASKLHKLRLQGKSTITWVGLDHIPEYAEGPGLYQLLNNEQAHIPFHFYLQKDNFALPKISHLRTHFHDELLEDKKAEALKINLLDEGFFIHYITGSSAKETADIILHKLLFAVELESNAPLKTSTTAWEQCYEKIVVHNSVTSNIAADSIGFVAQKK